MMRRVGEIGPQRLEGDGGTCRIRLAVQLLDRHLGFAAKFAHGLPLRFGAALPRVPLELSIHEL